MPTLIKIPNLDYTLHQILTPAQFLNLVKTDKKAIRKSKFIPPRLGTSDFGKVYVEYYYVPGKTGTTEG